MPSWKKIIVSGSNAELNQITATNYGGNVSGSSTSTGSFGRLEGDGSGLTGISSGVDIDSLDALGGTGVADSDKFIFSDAGTEKSITFSNSIVKAFLAASIPNNSYISLISFD